MSFRGRHILAATAAAALGLGAVVLGVQVIVAITGQDASVQSPDAASAPETRGEGAVGGISLHRSLGALEVHDEPRPVADVSFTDEAGGALSLEDFQGRVILVNLWATWCPPCVVEMPHLDRLQAMLGGERFEVVAISHDREGASVVRPFFERNGLEHLAVYLDTGMAASRHLEAPGLPTSIVIDREGREVARLMGEAEWDAPEFVTYLNDVIGLKDATDKSSPDS